MSTVAKKIRVSLRAVSESVHSKEIGQPLHYTAFLADGLSINSGPECIPTMSALVCQLGIHPFNLSKICERAEKRQEVNCVDLGDRKIFVVPPTQNEDETRSVIRALLEYACAEGVSALSFIHFSGFRGAFPKDQLRWILETMQDFDATAGPYRLWFEIASEHFAELYNLRAEVIAR